MFEISCQDKLTLNCNSPSDQSHKKTRVNKMKFSIVALVAAALTQLVATTPSPDPGHLEVVLSLDDTNMVDKPMIARPSSITLSTISSILPQPPPTISALFFLQRNGGLPASLSLIVEGKDMPLN